MQRGFGAQIAERVEQLRNAILGEAVGRRDQQPLALSVETQAAAMRFERDRLEGFAVRGEDRAIEQRKLANVSHGASEDEHRAAVLQGGKYAQRRFVAETQVVLDLHAFGILERKTHAQRGALQAERTVVLVSHEALRGERAQSLDQVPAQRAVRLEAWRFLEP